MSDLETSTPTPSEPPVSEPPVETPSAPETPSVSTQPPATSKQPKKSRQMMILVGILVVVVVGLGVGLAIAHHHHEEEVAAANAHHDIPLLTYGFDNNPLNVFYPNDAAAQGSLPLSEQIFEGLVKFNNGTQIVPNIASSWSNPNSTTWIFNLKHGIYFHDGDTVTAQDVVYSWKQVATTTQVFASYITPTIKNVQALNNYTVEITTVTPDAVLLNRLANLWILDSKAPAGTKPWALGTGPYTVKPGTTPTADNVDLVAFNKWHGGHISVRALNYIFYANPSQQVAALEDGKVDLIDEITQAEANQIDKHPGLTSFSRPNITVAVIMFYTKNPALPTANPKIRQAIDLTINQPAVIKAYDNGGIPIDQIVPPQVPGYNPSITYPANNIAEAKQLVKEAGYPNGVTITYGVGEPFVPGAEAMASELKAVGITWKLDVATDEGTYFNNANTGVYGAFGEDFSSNIIDGSDLLANWQNAPFYDNPTFDSALTAADETFNPAQRLSKLEAANQLLISDNAYIPLFQNVFIYGSKKGIVLPVNLYDQDLGTYFYDAYQKGN